MTTAVNRDAAQEAAYARYVECLESGKAFQNHEQSAASSTFMQRGTGWMKAADESTGALIVSLGKMAKAYRALMPVALAVIRNVNPHAARGEWEARLFASAREELAKGFDDVEKRSGPERYRFSECERPYTTKEKFVVLEVLAAHCRRGCVPGIGWCGQRFAGENCIRLRDHSDYFSKTTYKELDI